MRASVVINTYNREKSLSRTLDSLQYQTFNDFEVIVVNGPSTDGTEELLSQWADLIRIEDCTDRILGKSRNVGINASAGDVVAFIDDDAIPEPVWLQTLVDAYEDPTIGGAGGIVFDRTGASLQFRYSACDRLGVTDFDIRPPFERYLTPGADPFLYLQGTNCSFRRDVLVDVDGFDGEIEFMYDEVEVCLRVIDRGYVLKPLSGAAVHHKFHASHLRNEAGMMVNPYPAIKNRARFAFRYGLATHGESAVRASLATYVKGLQDSILACLVKGWITQTERDRLMSELDRGLTDGTRAGLSGNRPSAAMKPADPKLFKRFPTLRPEGQRLRLAFISGEYPPGYFGGIGRFTQDLALGLTEAGHEVHVVTPSAGEHQVELESGVWVHRVRVQDRLIPAIEHSPVKSNWLHLVAYYHEICSLHERLPLNLVSGPLWNCEPLVCLLDDRFPTVTTLMTTLQTVRAIHPSWAGSPNVEAMLALERITAGRSRRFHAISAAILRDVESQYGPLAGTAQVAPLGIRDRWDHAGKQEDARLQLLFVGRLERRKGVDVLLEVLPGLLREHPGLSARLIGQDTPNTEEEAGYRDLFERRHAGSPEITGRVEFAGLVTEEELYRAYSQCDLFCAPSRFESLGLVLVEAMMMGKPVVGCAVGGMVEVVDGNGLLAAPGDAESLRSCLDTLIRDAALRTAMGKRSRHLFETYWSLPLAVKRTAEAYAAVAHEHHASTPPCGIEAVVSERLSTLLQEAEHFDPAEAEETAEALLDRSCYPFDQRSALLRLWRLPDDEFVVGLYRHFLNRPPDPAGFEHNVSRLRLGVRRDAILRAISRAPEEIAAGIDDSLLEEAADWPSTTPAESDYPALLRGFWDFPPAAFVDRLYRMFLGREPDAAGLDSYTRRLAGGLRRSVVVREIALSPEAHVCKPDEPWLSVVEAWDSSTDPAEPESPAKPSASVGGMVGHVRSKARAAYRAARNLANLDAMLESQSHRISDSVKHLSADPAGTLPIPANLEGTLETLNSRMSRCENALDELIKSQQNTSEWVRVLQTKLEAMAKDLRERISVQPPASSLSEPLIPDQAAYSRLIEQMEGRVRVNLGCGEKPLPGYINIDARNLPGADVVADVRRLPFEPGTLAEISAAHLVEHFRTHHFSTVVLPYWTSLLREDGILRIICPNGEELIERVSRGELSVEDFRTVMFGLQDYSGDDHLAMYSPDLLRPILESAGFKKVQLIAAARQNGLCPEMEMVASSLVR